MCLICVVLEESVEYGVVYFEIFLLFDFCGGGDLGVWCEYLYVIEEEVVKVEIDLGIMLCGVVICICYFGFEKVKVIVKCVVEIKGNFIIGLGLVGVEM